MWFLDYQKYPDFTNAKGWTVCVGGLCQGITKQILTYIYMHCSGLQIAPFAASHSRGTKLPCWRAKVELEWDKQRKSPFKTMLAFCLSWPRATFALQHGGEWLAAKGLIWRENSLQKDLPHFLYIFSKLFFKIIILPQILWSFQCTLHSSWWLCFFYYHIFLQYHSIQDRSSNSFYLGTFCG